MEDTLKLLSLLNFLLEQHSFSVDIGVLGLQLIDLCIKVHLF